MCSLFNFKMAIEQTFFIFERGYFSQKWWFSHAHNAKTAILYFLGYIVQRDIHSSHIVPWS